MVHRQRNNSTRKALMGEIGKGKARKAGIEPTDWINHRMGGLGTWRRAEGVLRACTARQPCFTHPCGWDYVFVLGLVNQVQQNSHTSAEKNEVVKGQGKKRRPIESDRSEPQKCRYK